MPLFKNKDYPKNLRKQLVKLNSN